MATASMHGLQQKVILLKNTITQCCTSKRSLLFTAVLVASKISLAQSPTITSFSPSQASAGTSITINGTNFTGTTAVSFGGAAAASFIINSSTKITAVLGYGSSGTVVVTNGSGSANLAGFYYQSLNRIITDFGGYWSSSLTSTNSTKPDSSHNLLAFRYNNIIYSTGANDAKLTANGVSFTASTFRALPVAGIAGNNPGGSVYLALAKKVDGSANVANPATVSGVTLRSALTDGANGLDLGTGFTNLPSSANLTFNVYSIDTTKISDAEPDIVLTQIAQPVSGNDIFSLVDASGTLVGNTVTQDMTLLNPFGTYDLDLFNLTPNAPFNTATAYSAASTNTNREIRLVALKLSDFGINSSNYTQVKMLKISPSTNSDYAFIAYNTSSLNMPPNITQNTNATNSTVCSGGTAGMEVIATAAAGGSLTYSWELSTNGGSSWSTVTDGGSVSGASTKRLTVTGPVNASQYRATVTESGSNLSSTSSVFTITVNAPTAPTAVSISGGATVCRYNALQLTSSVTGGSNLYYQWQSAASSGGPYTDITGANSSTYLPPVSATGTWYYRLRVSSGSGCAGSVTSSSQTVTVTGIASVTPNYNCGSGAVTLSAVATSGTIDWYTVDGGGSSLYTGNSYTTPSISTTTTYYATASGCSSAIREPVTATIYAAGQWTGGTSGDWNIAGNWCGGIPTSSSNVVIPAGSVVTIQSANAVANSININSGGSLVMTGAYNLGITAGGSFINNGTYTASGSTGTVAFLGAGTVSGTTTFKNIDAYGALNFGTASTVSGTFSLQTGGSVTGNSPYYTCPASVLLYKPGAVFTRGLEWTNAVSGAGYPSNVYLQNNTTVNFPGAGAGYICNDLQIESGSSLRQDYSGGSAALRVGRNVTIGGTLSLGSSSGGDIYVGGNWTRNSNGVFNANNRIVTFDGPTNFSGNGTSMSTVSAPASSAKDNEGGFGGEKFAHLWVNKTNTTDSVVLLSNITVTREVGFTRGTFSLRNSDVTLVSNSSRTADIAPITNTANISMRYGGSGRFVVQRYIPNPTNTRSWRLLTAPLQSTGAPSVNTAWQEGVVNPDKTKPNDSSGIFNPWPGYGTHITGPGGAYSLTNGFDQGTNSASILYAGSDLAWTAPASTTSSKITDHQGWMLFIRGDRSFTIGTQYTPAQNTTLEPKGRINIGNVSVHADAGKQVIGNPYASAISLLNVSVAGSPGSSSTYYMWDPKMYTSYTQPGKWVTFTGVGSGFVQTTSESAYASDGNIESGQAFILDVPTAGNIIFHESDKKALSSSLIGITNPTSARPAANNFAMLRSDIYVDNGAGYKVTDGVLSIYNGDYENAVTGADAKKMINLNTKESLSILRNDSVKIAIEKRKDILVADTIFFATAKFNELPYQFRFDANGFSTGLQAWLEDNYTGNRTELNTNGTSKVDFNITADAGSKAANRFRVVFKNAKAATLPVSFTNVKAWSQNGKVTVQWNVENELNIRQYEIERSTDGRTFTKTGLVPAGGANTYNWIDEYATAAGNYYRVVSVEAGDKMLYSRVVKAGIAAAGGKISLQNNPVTNGNIQFRLENIKPGRYTINLYDNMGKRVINKELVYDGRSSFITIPVSAATAKGIYYTSITGTGISKKMKLIIE
ncbi:MAG: T9SS type A sorting domain-containing protein [Ferruginibacter sp.]